MANPSTVNPTASGKEVLRRTFLDGGGESGNIILTAPDDHICTIISLVIIDRASLSDSMFDLYVKPDGGADLFFMVSQPLGYRATFIMSDKFVMTGGDILKIEPASASGTALIDVWCSYIDADFS